MVCLTLLVLTFTKDKFGWRIEVEDKRSAIRQNVSNLNLNCLYFSICSATVAAVAAVTQPPDKEPDFMENRGVGLRIICNEPGEKAQKHFMQQNIVLKSIPKLFPTESNERFILYIAVTQLNFSSASCILIMNK